MGETTSLRAALAWLRLTTWQERIGLVLVALLVIALLAVMVLQGQNVGAHIWQSGWACGETLKGSPTCLPNQKGP